MGFTARLNAPSTTDKNWIHTSAGGKNSCIKVSGNSVLPNCFRGDTRFITKDGIKTLQECVGLEVDVLTEDGTFKKATVKHFGKNELVKLKFGDGTEVYTTPNHRWLVDKFSRDGDKKYEKRVEKITDELTTSRNDNFPIISRNGADVVEFELDGIRHGFIYGDGKKRQAGGCEANICGYKKEFMPKYFEGCNISECKNGTLTVSGKFPDTYKEIPSLENSDEYLMGFLIGYIAADGSMSGSTCCIASHKVEDLLKVKDICSRLLIKTKAIKTEIRDKAIGKYEYKDHVMYRLPICMNSLSADMFLNPQHKAAFEAVERKKIKHTHLIEIERTGIVDDVYCVVEPVTHSFVLDGHILTGNCVGYAWGRFMEILGSTPKLSRSNAENWWGNTADGYKRGQTPKLGAVICWRKGKAGVASDGAGHVAIVEKIYSDGSILISQSGYKSTRFWTSTVKKGYALSGYVFQGFIYNPAVTSTTVSTTTTDYKIGGTYTLKANMKVRTGAGTNYRQKKTSELTADGRKHAQSGTYAVLKNGTLVTCQKVVKSGSDTWLKIPSGYVCAKKGSTVYIR